jgi:membrane protein insertase Oxa1/YidC/SpoIIIJ
LFGLYLGLQRVIKDPHQMVDFAYPFLQNLSWLQQLKANIGLFDSSLFGIVDLSKAAISSQGLYIPALIIVIASAVTQYFQAKQLIPNDKDARSLRAIMKDAGDGKQADQQEVSAAIGRSTKYFLPVMIFVFTVNIASALGLYWFIGGLVAFIQQSIVLREDKEEMQELSEEKPSKRGKDASRIPEAEVIKGGPKGGSRKQQPVAEPALVATGTDSANDDAGTDNAGADDRVTEKQTPSGTVKITRQSAASVKRASRGKKRRR